MCPKVAFKLSNFRKFARLACFLDLAVPFIGAFEYLENRGKLRVTDLDDTYLYGEKCKGVYCMLVEPANR